LSLQPRGDLTSTFPIPADFIFAKSSGVTTLEELFDLIDTDLFETDDKEFKLVPPEYFVWEDHRWVLLTQVTRHKQTEPVRMLSDGSNVLISQETHKVAIHKNLSRCSHCNHPSIKKKKTAKKSTCCKCSKLTEALPNQFEEAFSLVEGKSTQVGDFNRIDNSPVTHFSGREETTLKYSGYVVGFFLAEGCVVYTRKKSKATKEYLPYKAARVEIYQNATEIKQYFLEHL